MKSNEVLQNDVQDAIKWEPQLNAAAIGVTAKDGIITLTGVVDSFARKSEAEEAARKVDGVKAVVEEIEIKSGSWANTSDTEIATEVLNAFKWNWEIPGDKIKVKVEDGWVTLDGEIFWKYQKDAAKKSSQQSCWRKRCYKQHRHQIRDKRRNRKTSDCACSGSQFSYKWGGHYSSCSRSYHYSYRIRSFVVPER